MYNDNLVNIPDDLSNGFSPYFLDIWDSGIALGIYVSGLKSIVNQRILELGCGCGIGGLFAAQFGAEVVFSDNQSYAIDLARLNCSINGIKNASFNIIDWCNDNADNEKYDFVMGADLIYENDAIRSLLLTIDNYTSKSGEFIYADPSRSNLDSFNEKLKKMDFSLFNYEVVNHEILNSKKGIEIFHFKR